MPGNDALHNQIAEGLALIAQNVVGGTASISNMRGAWPYPKSNLPPAPQTVIGPPAGQITPGSWEVLQIRFPMRVYVGRLHDAAQTQHDINEFVDAFLAAFRTGITLAVTGVVQATIEKWETDRYYTLQGEDYQAIDFTVLCVVARPETYTP